MCANIFKKHPVYAAVNRSSLTKNDDLILQNSQKLQTKQTCYFVDSATASRGTQFNGSIIYKGVRTTVRCILCCY